MSLVEQIKKRRSIRVFRSQPPPREMVLQCLDAASFAPNLSNMQPWKFVVLTGDKLMEITTVIEENFAAAFETKEAGPPPHLSESTRNALAKRKSAERERMLAALKERDVDVGKLAAGNFNFHSAPVAVLFATYRWKDDNLLKSTMAAMENFMLAADSLGLGTCWSNAVSICQDAIKSALGLPDDMLLVDGIALGYPNEESPVNSLERTRLPVEQVTTWY